MQGDQKVSRGAKILFWVVLGLVVVAICFIVYVVVTLYIFKGAILDIGKDIHTIKNTKAGQEAMEFLNEMTPAEQLQYLQQKKFVRKENQESFLDCPYDRLDTITMLYEDLDVNKDGRLEREEFAQKYPDGMYPTFWLKCGSSMKYAIFATAFCFKNCKTLTDYHENQILDFT